MQPVDVQKQLIKLRRTSSGSVEQGYLNERQEIEDAEQSLARMVGRGSIDQSMDGWMDGASVQ